MTAIQPDDLEAAVAAGVLPETQADALRAFVAKRHLAPVRSGMEDERFRFHARVQRFLLRDRHRAAGRRYDFLHRHRSALLSGGGRVHVGLVGIAGPQNAPCTSRNIAVGAVCFLHLPIDSHQSADLRRSDATRDEARSVADAARHKCHGAIGHDQGPDRGGHCRALLLALPAAFHDPADRSEPGSLGAGGDLVSYQCPFGSARIRAFSSPAALRSLPQPWPSTSRIGNA